MQTRMFHRDRMSRNGERTHFVATRLENEAIVIDEAVMVTVECINEMVTLLVEQPGKRPIRPRLFEHESHPLTAHIDIVVDRIFRGERKKAKIGVWAPPHIPVDRKEVHEEKKRTRRKRGKRRRRSSV